MKTVFQQGEGRLLGTIPKFFIANHDLDLFRQ
jgi:hypothetical protein